MKKSCKCGNMSTCPICHENEKAERSPVERGVMCACMTWAGYYPESWGRHHHKNCEKYKTQKYPYLFHYEEAVDAWVPAPDALENIIVVEDQLETDEVVQIQFKRVDMTDEEIESLPEA